MKASEIKDKKLREFNPRFYRYMSHNWSNFRLNSRNRWSKTIINKNKRI